MKTYDLLYSKPFRNFLISNGMEGKRIYARMKLYGMKKVERDDSLFEAIPEIEDWYIRFITEYIIPSLRSTYFKELSNDSNNTQFMFTKDLSARKIKNNSVFLDLEAFTFYIFENRAIVENADIHKMSFGYCIRSIYEEDNILFIPSVFDDYCSDSTIRFKFPSGLFISFTDKLGLRQLLVEDILLSIIKNDRAVSDIIYDFGYAYDDSEDDHNFDPNHPNELYYHLIRCIIKEFLRTKDDICAVDVEYTNYKYSINFTLHEKIYIKCMKDSLCDMINNNIDYIFNSEDILTTLCCKLFDINRGIGGE